MSKTKYNTSAPAIQGSVSSANAANTNVLAPKPRKRIITTRASDIEPEPIDWLWPNYLARGMHFIFHGRPEAGKGTLVASIVSTVTSGGKWPTGEPARKGSVIWLNAEDVESYTLIPRLMAAGAEMSSVHLVQGTGREAQDVHGFDLKSDLALLEDYITSLADVALVVFDPLNSYLPGINMNDQIEVREALEPVKQMAERTGVTIISIAHDVKGSNYATSASKIAGSGAYEQAARGTYAIDWTDKDDKDAQRRFIADKLNIAAKPKGLGFRITGKTITTKRGNEIEASHVVWDDEPLDIGAEEAMRVSDEGQIKPTAVKEAKDFLGTLLFAGPVPFDDVKSEAAQAGISEAALRRAKTEMGIKSKKADGTMSGQWYWSLPGNREDAQALRH